MLDKYIYIYYKVFMTPNVRRFVEVISNCLNMESPIIEIGSYIIKGQEELANLRGLFPNHKYIGCDIRKGSGVDRIEDVESLSFKSGSVKTVLILETLEHVRNPMKALGEIYRVLSDDGVVVLSSLMKFKIHEYPQDYWRFTPQGLENLLSLFPVKLIGYCGETVDHPTNVFGIGFKNYREDITFLVNTLQKEKLNIAGRKPWKHRLSRATDLLKKAMYEPLFKYNIDFYIVN